MRGSKGERGCKDTIEGAMGGTVGWCDRVEREMASRGIKGFGNVFKRRWQQEGGLQGEKEGRGGKVGGMEEEKGGPRDFDWRVKC